MVQDVTDGDDGPGGDGDPVASSDIADIDGLPAPTLVGPSWRSCVGADCITTPLDESSKSDSPTVVGETGGLQDLLAKLGYYDGAKDNVFGPKTTTAVKRFQEYAQLTPDGVVGPHTRGVLGSSRNDLSPDVVNDGAEVPQSVYSRGQTVTYSVGSPPGYLVTTAVEEEVAGAFAQWAVATGIVFQQAGEGVKNAVDIHLSWSSLSPRSGRRFDGPGGLLAEATAKTVTLDYQEVWRLQGEPAGVGDFFIYPVVLHEIGHALGLTHSSRRRDVMSPFYVHNRCTLSRCGVRS